MKIKIVQTIVDILRFKYLKKQLKNYFINHPVLIKYLSDFFSFLFNTGSDFRTRISRFCGAKLGKNVFIGDSTYINMPQNLELEDYVSIGDNNIIHCWDKVHIGKYTFLATSIKLVAGSHRTDNYENLQNQEIYIGKGCWIGANCTIMGGTKIGNGSIVGAGAVLTGKEYPPFSIIVGVPARVIKQRMPSKIINIPTTYSTEELMLE